MSLKPKHERFSLATSEEVEAAKKPVIPPNTAKSTDWAVRVFQSWLNQRNNRVTDEKCILLTDDCKLLCRWLCVFASETRKEDGSQYAPRSIVQMFAGLQRYINDATRDSVRPVGPMNSTFKPLHQLLDRHYHDLHAQGVGSVKSRLKLSQFLRRKSFGSQELLEYTHHRLFYSLFSTTTALTSFFEGARNTAS